ncbi:MAG: PD40 domain-containing protein [Bacteroidetes bacterium]|nr:PD40 domain-containing protein [Bacteroidota bacterium]
MKIQLYFSFFCITLSSFAQKAVDTDVWVGRITILDAINPVFSTPVNLTNRKGYDNQPFFAADNQRLFYSTTINNQNDIWVYDFTENVNMHATKTKESEFSPKETPDKRYISTVRIDLDSVQRLWKYDQTDLTRKFEVDKSIDSIGYYTWIAHKSLAWFKITEPPSLWLQDLDSKKSMLIANNCGRTFLGYGNDSLITTLIIDGKRVFAIVPLKNTNKIEYLIDSPDMNSQDFVVIAINGKKYIWTSFGKKLVSYEIGSPERKWNTIADFTKYEIKTINRLAISKDLKRYAFSSEE